MSDELNEARKADYDKWRDRNGVTGGDSLLLRIWNDAYEAAWNRRTTSGAASGEETNEHWIAITASGYMCAFGNSGLAYAWAGPKGEVRHVPHRVLPTLVEARPAEQSAPPVPCIPRAVASRLREKSDPDYAVRMVVARAQLAEEMASVSPVPRAQGGIANDNNSNSLATQSVSTAPGQAELERDAARYRWLRQKRDIPHGERNIPWAVALDPTEKIHTMVLRVESDLDSAIDSAIAALSKEKS